MQIAKALTGKCPMERCCGACWKGLRRLRGIGDGGADWGRSRCNQDPIATPRQGAWYRGRRLVRIWQAANEAAFGRPGASRGRKQLRFVALLENGTHVHRDGGLWAGREHARPRGGGGAGSGDAVFGDRNFFSYALWILWRVKKNLRQRLADGSYRSKIYPSRRRDQEGLAVRVIRLEGIRTVSVDDPAEELAALYHERWEIETALDSDPLAGSTHRFAQQETGAGGAGVLCCCWLISRYGV